MCAADSPSSAFSAIHARNRSGNGRYKRGVSMSGSGSGSGSGLGVTTILGAIGCTGGRRTGWSNNGAGAGAGAGVGGFFFGNGSGFSNLGNAALGLRSSFSAGMSFRSTVYDGERNPPPRFRAPLAELMSITKVSLPFSFSFSMNRLT
jgi:hypothetical protein